MVRKLHYVQEEVSCDSLSSGERNGNSPNLCVFICKGVVGRSQHLGAKSYKIDI